MSVLQDMLVFADKTRALDAASRFAQACTEVLHAPSTAHKGSRSESLTRACERYGVSRADLTWACGWDGPVTDDPCTDITSR